MRGRRFTNFFGKLTSVVAPPAVGQPISFAANLTSVPNVTVMPQPALAFERTQPFTVIAKINVPAPPTAGATPAAIIFTTCNQGAANTAFPGFEFWIDGTGLLRVRLISNIVGPNFIGVKNTLNITGAPHIVAASYDGSSTAAGVKIYVDGVQVATTVESDTLTASILPAQAQPLLLGNQIGFPFSLGGTLAEFLLTKEVLTPAQIAAFTTAAAAVDANTALAFNFSENTGKTTADLSPNGFTGFVTNAVWQSGQVGRAPFFVNQNSAAQAGAVSSLAVNLGALVQSGHAVVVTVSLAATNTLNVTVTDDKANTYTLIHKNTSFSGIIFATYVCGNITNAPSVITATLSSGTGTFWGILGTEFGNINAVSNPVDTFSDLFTASASAAVNGVTSGNFTTTNNVDLIYGTSQNFSAVKMIAGTPGFITLSNTTAGNNSEYAIQKTAGATAATMTMAAGNELTLAGIALKSA